MINLLPPQFKKELRQEENFKIISILEITILVFLISLTLILLSIKIYTQSQINSQKILVELESKTAQSSEFQSLFKKISSVNQDVSKIVAFYHNEIRPSEILEKISQIIPPQIYLNTFFWQKESSQVTLSGFAPSRDILFEFKKKLEEKGEFNEIHFPSQNWVKSSDIDFNVNFKIK